MKRLVLLISFSILCLFSFPQTNVQQDNRINPVLRNTLAARSGYYIYGRTSTSRFINIAVLNQSSHTLCWFTCHGRLFDSTKLTNQEFEQVTSKLSDPFVLYQNICDKYLAVIAAAKDIYRVYGDKQLFDSLNLNYRALFAMESVRTAKTPLQKLMAIENVRKNILTQLAYLNCGSPFGLSDNPLYKTNKEQAGAMIRTKDSTVYYNIDPTSAVTKISLNKNSPEKLYIYNRLSQLIDSVPVLPEKYNLLLKEKTDVFLLYRGWLELQWQNTVSAIRRLTTGSDINKAGVFSQVNIGEEKAIEKELYSQLHAIGAKINLLILPEVKSIEQAVYDTYKSEASEISYIPLLGIGYELNQKRGFKEYELTNHLGNVLATVSDKKIGVSSASDSSLIDHYEPDIVSAQDYYPFGMLQPGRSYLSSNGDKYRYGFNGKENDNEVKGEGNQQDYGMRIYDPRIGKFLSLDPLQAKYPFYTPYSFAGNKPIVFIDRDGEEEALEMYTRRLEEALLSHKITPAEYKQKIQTRAMGGVIGGAFVADVFFTKGTLTKTALKATGAWAYLEMVSYTNNNSNQHDPKIKAENDRKAKQLATDLVVGFGVGYLFTKGLQAGKMFYQKAKGFVKAGPVDPMTAEMSQPLTEPLPIARGGTVKAKDLKIVHKESTITSSSSYEKIKKMSDKELIESVIHPSNYDPVRINVKTGSVVDGNTRIYEIQRRGLDVDVPVKEYYPDDSSFPILKEPPPKKQ